MRFSLILGTKSRTDELARSLDALDRQVHRDFELIVVDQNPDGRLVPILASYADRFPILHLRSEKGLSKAKNLGLRHASSEIVGFPDDDCQFPPDTLEKVARFFDAHPEADGLTGRSINEFGEESMGRFDTRPGRIDKFNVWGRSIAYSIFLRSEAVRGTWFDQAMGPGAGTPWGAADETDYLLRLLERGACLYYDPGLAIVHPSSMVPHNDSTFQKVHSYALGVGHVLRKHRYPIWFKAKLLIRPLGGAVLSIIGLKTPEAKYYWSTFKGRFRGLARLEVTASSTQRIPSHSGR
jgi:glycosyltransferase involved in cell wall biosynthesis